MTRVSGPPVPPEPPTAGAPFRVAILVRSLDAGGAERQLVEILRGLPAGRCEVLVASLYDAGALRAEIETCPAVTLRSFSKRRRWDLAPVLWRLARAVRAFRPAVLMGYMSPGNELATLLGPWLRARVAWNLRSAQLDLDLYDWLPRAFFRAGAWLSQWPDAIIVNSDAGRRHFAKHGYRIGRMRVIPNGIDTTRFTPRRDAGLALRREWGIDARAQLVGLVARIDPIKGHDVFLAAARRLVATHPVARFVCIGSGDPALESLLRAQATSLGLDHHVVWAGHQADVTAAYCALDVAVSASRGEGLPNAVAEAMACGVPCVVTDVGDSAALVGETGLVVPPADPESLAAAMGEMLERVPDDRLASACRQRIIDRYATQRLGREMMAVLDELARGRHGPLLSNEGRESGE